MKSGLRKHADSPAAREYFYRCNFEEAKRNGHETLLWQHFYLWDVTKAKRLVRDRISSSYIEVPEWYEGAIVQDRRTVNVEYAMSDAVDLDVPVIMMEIAPGIGGGAILLDGAHRLYRAHHEGIDALPIHVISREDERQIRLRGLWDDIWYT